MCPTSESLKLLFDYLYVKGYIAKCEFSENIETLFSNIILTDDATSLIFSKHTTEQLNNANCVVININPTLNFNGAKLG